MDDILLTQISARRFDCTVTFVTQLNLMQYCLFKNDIYPYYQYKPLIIKINGTKMKQLKIFYSNLSYISIILFLPN